MVIVRLLIAVLLLLPAPAFAGWVKASSPHFMVYGDDSPADIEAFTRKVERFDALLRVVTGGRDAASPNKLTIFVVRDILAVGRAMGTGGDTIAGFYAPLITGSIAVVPRPRTAQGKFDLTSETVLFHEYAHHFMLQYFPAAYPPWYVEGFAEYFSTTQFRDDGSVAIGTQALHRAYDLQSIETFPLTGMFSSEPGAVARIGMSEFYGTAWLLTHYLRFAPDRQGQLTKYLALYSSGTPNDQAAVQAFGPIDQLQRDLKLYQGARTIRTSRLSGFAPPVAVVTVEPLSKAESDMAPLYLRFARGSQNANDVKRFAVEARKLADRYPGEPMALEMLAEGELDAQRLDAAAKANDALVALRPADARALLRAARISAARLGDTGDADGWRKVRLQIVRANHQQPDDAFTLYAYYASFLSAKVAPTPLAVSGLTRALELAPQVQSLRMALGIDLMKAGQRDRARIVLAPLLSDPHREDVRAAARAVLAGDAEATEKTGGEQNSSAGKGDKPR